MSTKMFVKVKRASGRAICKICDKNIKKNDQQMLITWTVNGSTGIRVHLRCMKQICDRSYKDPKISKTKVKSREEMLIFK